jgi:hypothetical protein
MLLLCDIVLLNDNKIAYSYFSVKVFFEGPKGSLSTLSDRVVSGLLPLVRVQGPQRPFLILAHEAAVALDIGTEDGCELAFNMIRGHE